MLILASLAGLPWLAPGNAQVRVFPASRRWHPLLMEALSGIPDVRAGGFVWWHCDMIHSVAPAENQHGWGTVM